MLWIKRIAWLGVMVFGIPVFGSDEAKGPSPDVPEAAQLKLYVGKFKQYRNDDKVQLPR